jgi:adenylyltransferase/sulfurtransferase
MMERYNRQARFAPFGAEGQHQLMKTRIMIMGGGALGSHLAEQLARMGVGHLTVIDMDVVELSNLHRQALYDEHDAESMSPKVEVLKKKISRINRHVGFDALHVEMTPRNIEEILDMYQPDIVLDGMDNFEMRFLINEACHKLGIPWVYGAAVGSKGTVYAMDYTGPCLKCMLDIIPDTGESCAINGVLPPAIHQVISYEIGEVIRHVSGEGFSKKLISFDIFTMKNQTMDIDGLKDGSCPVCDRSEYELLNKKESGPIEALCGGTYLFRLKRAAFDSAEHLPGNIKKETPFVKLISYKGIEMTVFQDGRMNVYGIPSDDLAYDFYRTLLKSIR